MFNPSFFVVLPKERLMPPKKTIVSRRTQTLYLTVNLFGNKFPAFLKTDVSCFSPFPLKCFYYNGWKTEYHFKKRHISQKENYLCEQRDEHCFKENNCIKRCIHYTFPESNLCENTKPEESINIWINMGFNYLIAKDNR